MKNNRGEISIEMIITVIVLIIIGGICIFMLTGENGLFVPKEEQVNNNKEVITENTTNTNNSNQENTLITQ